MQTMLSEESGEGAATVDGDMMPEEDADDKERWINSADDHFKAYNGEACFVKQKEIQFEVTRRRH